MDRIIEWIEKLGKVKIYWVLVALSLVLCSVYARSYDHREKQFTSNDLVFRYVGFEERQWVFNDAQGRELRVQNLSGDGYPGQFDSVAIVYDGKYIEKNVDMKNHVYTVSLNGEVVKTGDIFDVIAGYAIKGTKYDGGVGKGTTLEIALVNGVIDVIDYIRGPGIAQLILLNIFLSIFGALQLIYPRALWLFQHVLTVKDGEPTDFFIVTTRISGVAFYLASFAVPIGVMMCG